MTLIKKQEYLREKETKNEREIEEEIEVQWRIILFKNMNCMSMQWYEFSLPGLDLYWSFWQLK